MHQSCWLTNLSIAWILFIRFAALKPWAHVHGIQSTVIAVLHDLDLAARYCDDLLLLHEGEVLAWGDPLEVLTPANLLQAYSIRPPKNPEATGLNVSLWNCKDD